MQARCLPAAAGASWLFAGWHLFRRNPFLLTALTLSYVFVIIAINLIPLVGPFFLPLSLPMLLVTVANGCRAIDTGYRGGGNVLVRGLRERQASLLQLGGLHLLGSLVVLAVNLLLGNELPVPNGEAPVDEIALARAMGSLLLVALPAILAFWFAPLLTAWDGVSPLKSVFFSFVAALRNWRAFAVYLLSSLFLTIGLPGVLLVAANAISPALAQNLSVLIRLAIVLVAAPILMSSVYVSYRQVFHLDDAGR